MADNLKPTVIDELPFPSLKQLEGGIDGSGNKDILTPKEIKPISFPAVQNIRFPSIDLQARTILSPFTFSQFGAIEIGHYNTGAGVRISPNGIVGGVAGVPKFTLNALTGDATFAGTLAAGVVVVSGALTVGTNVGLGTAQDSAGVTTIVGNTITTGYVNALNVQAKTVAADWVYAGTINANQINSLTINANQITAGTITIGGTNQPTAITIQESSLTGNARLGFQHGSRIWEDSSSRIGINSIGTMYIYINSGEQIIIPSGGQTTIRNGVYCDGNLNSIGTTKLHGSVLLVEDHITFSNDSGAKDFSIRDMGLLSYHDTSGGRDRDVLQWGDGCTFGVDRTGSWFHVNGNDKSAIVPTSQGYKALYCAEAPEVWFFDFCPNKDEVDPMFLEVTEGELRFIKCDIGYQVWGKRKGHAHKRFEKKSALQFYKNERFLGLAK